jgi:hypothetical protein
MAKSKKRKTLRLMTADDLLVSADPPPSESRAGSIEQHLDMMEQGPLRGDESLRLHRMKDRLSDRPSLSLWLLEHNYQVDMSEETREGDEESGDEHSSGLQGADQQELQYDTEGPEDSDSGAPGEMTEKNAHLDPTRKGYRRRAV